MGSPRRTWMKDVCEWTGLGTYERVKRAAEEKKSWKRIVVNLRIEVEK